MSDNIRSGDDLPRRRPVRRDEPVYEAETDDGSAPPPKKGGGSVLIILLVFLGGFLLLTCTCCSVGGYFAYEWVEDNRQKSVARNNMVQIGLSFHNRHDSMGSIPEPWYRTKDGKPGLSWRVAILPYIEHGALYQRFRTDEPWDSPNNKPLLAQMPKIYGDKRHTDPTVTSLRAFVGPGTAFEWRPSSPKGQGLRFADFTDGLSNTIMIAESDDAVPWTKPDEMMYDPMKPLPRLYNRNGFHMILLGDGSVRYMKATVPERTLRILIGRHDGLIAPNDW